MKNIDLKSVLKTGISFTLHPELIGRGIIEILELNDRGYMINEQVPLFLARTEMRMAYNITKNTVENFRNERH